MTTVYASSLASVTQIAADPPDHFNLPVQGIQLPLVLYIARVPGSRDVFLTPIKPRDRVVTAEDVQSSLYYVHVNAAEDFDAPPRKPPRPSSVNSDAFSLLPGPGGHGNGPPQLPKRPVSLNIPPYPLQNQMPNAVRNPPSPPKANAVIRKPLPPPRPTVFTEISPNLDVPRLSSRPLPALPSEDGHDVPSRLNINTNSRSTPTQPYNDAVASPLSAAAETQLEPGSLTLIRRDPSSSEQWNVATINDPPLHDISSATYSNTNSTAPSRRTGDPIYLTVTNPSYSQFLGAEQPSASLPPRAHADSVSPNSFQRRLFIPGLSYAPFNPHSFHTSSASLSSLAPSRLSNSKSYTFTSPWSTRCEFHTGASGKTLKCRHILPTGACDVSELRFNLPTSTSSTAAVKFSNSHAASKENKRGSYLHRRMWSVDSSLAECDDDWKPSLVLDEDGRIDLSLGKERAGGGFAGRAAKLGKLIVEGEGVKMLDLVVAANVGLWWRAYEKV